MTRALVIIGCLLAIAVLAATQSQFFSGDVIVAGNVRDPGGTNYIKDAPATGGPYGRQTNAWVVVGSLSEAPMDGQFYGRASGAWVSGEAAGYIKEPASTLIPYVRYGGGWDDARDWFSELGHGHVIADTTGLQGALDSKAATNHTHVIADTTGLQTALDGKAASSHGHVISDVTGLQGALDSKAATNHTHAAADVTSGEFASARLGSGTPSTNTFLRGRSGGGHEWATLPGGSSDTNGVPEAPSDGTAYARKNASWVGLDIVDVAGVTSFGASFLAATDDVDALDLLGLVGSGVATIDSPAKYGVRVNSGGGVSTRHRLNLIAGSGISLSLTDDGAGDESDLTVSLGSHTHDWADITGEPSFVETSRAINSGTGLTGGGNLSADRTLSVSFGTTSTTVASGNRGLPTGGSTGQVLKKSSGTDYDVSWGTDNTSSGGLGVARPASDYTVTSSIGLVICNTSDEIDVTLPTTGLTDGQQITVVRIGGGLVNVYHGATLHSTWNTAYRISTWVWAATEGVFIQLFSSLGT